MKFFSVVPVLFLAVWTAAAQTNTSVTAGATRAMSLQDCVQEALVHNLDLQIQRYNPSNSFYNLKSAYGGYDPTFSFSGTHNYNDSGAEFQNGQRVAGSEFNSDTYNTALNGGTPWGMTYDLFGNVSSTDGKNPLANTNLFVPIQNSSGQVGLSLTQPLLKDFWID